MMQRYTKITNDKGGFAPKIGQIDLDPALGALTILDDGTIESTDERYGSYYWAIGRREDGTLVAYLPGLADVYCEEMTEAQFENMSERRIAIRAAANKGGY